MQTVPSLLHLQQSLAQTSTTHSQSFVEAEVSFPSLGDDYKQLYAPVLVAAADGETLNENDQVRKLTTNRFG